MQLGPQLKAVFFDIGGTLGRVSGLHPVQLKAFKSSVALLQTMGQTLGLKVGIITNIPPDRTNKTRRSLAAIRSLDEIEPIPIKGLFGYRIDGADALQSGGASSLDRRLDAFNQGLRHCLCRRFNRLRAVRSVARQAIPQV